MLTAIELAGSAGLPTRDISRKHGWATLVNAERAGYIRREIVPRPKGQMGYRFTMNYLTAKGSKLLRELGGEREAASS